jgi:hypothetical protein
MRRLTTLLLIACLPAVAVAQVPMSAVPAPCASLDTMTVQPSGQWQMGADSLMHTPEADTARRYAGTSMWACKRHTGEIYIKTYTGEAVDVSGAIQQAIMRRIPGDRTSPYWVGNFDHPARPTAILMHHRDGTKMMKKMGLPTDSLWTSN